MTNNNGYLIISLDFELLWGVFDLVNPEEKQTYFKNTRKVIPKILNLFEQYDIKATWAIVGMLFHENWKDWENNFPEQLPEYENLALSAYSFGETIKSFNFEEMVFAPDLIQKIKETTGQEIGTHTYSHYYCLEENQNLLQFEKDLEKAIEIARSMNIELKSLVFPRNQLKEEYLSVCHSLGITNVRSNPSNWYWHDTASNSLFTKIARTGDAYVPLGNKSYNLNDLRCEKNMPIEHKASRFLRPMEGNSLLRKLKLQRIKGEMTKAAKNKEVYHLWWHPHNFGDRPQDSLNDLKTLLLHFNLLQKQYNFRSSNMNEIGELLRS